MKELVVFAVLMLPSIAALGADDSVLHLVNGDFLPGTLQDSDQPAVLRWKSSSFTQPLEFSRENISAVHYGVPATLPKPQGEYCVELCGGDVLFGDLLSLNDISVELDAGRLGRLHVTRDQICRLYRWNSRAELIYLGPNGLIGWTESVAKQPQWRSEGGHPLTEQPGTHIRGDFRITPQALIEFELSWTKLPNFIFALGVDDSDSDVIFKRSFRFEVWDSDLVVGCEQAREADVEAVQTIQRGPGHIHLLAYLDQEAGKLLVYSPTGERLAQVGVTPRKKQVYSGLRLANKQGDVRLDRLRISRWDGVPPREVQTNKSRLHRTDGSVVYGQLTAYDAKAQQFSVRNEMGDVTIVAADVAHVFMAEPHAAPEMMLRAVYQDGTRLGGELVRVIDGFTHVKNPFIEEPLRLPLVDLRSILLQPQGKSALTSPVSEKGIAKLELDGLRLRGRLAAGDEQADASCLVWHPEHSKNASPLVPGISGRIVYREPPPPSRPQATPYDPAMIRVLGGRVITSASRPPPTAIKSNAPKMLHLRSGDAIPCEVSKIDEAGITFTTPISEAKFVAHDKVKAVELIAGQPPPKLAKAKRERLLTLPRLQKESPPTHLICLVNGDFLRGRLVDMDDKTLHIEVRLENKEVSRFQVAQIIWLHPDELSETPVTPDATAQQSPKTRVQAMRSDGIRLTYFPSRYSDQSLYGTSEVLGACRTDELQVDQLLIGKSIDQAATALAYHRWKLHPAVEPKVATAEEGSASAGKMAGTESALVGKPAPQFELPLLDGKSFRLADKKGSIIVLDFWASWCGPCMQAMPQVDGVVREFDNLQVQWLAVNLEEPVKQITSTLERHKLQIPVGLDRDGTVSAKFEVTAIPQTVVIDREGKVVRLFVGGGSQFPDQLRDAIRELLARDEKKAS